MKAVVVLASALIVTSAAHAQSAPLPPPEGWGTIIDSYLEDELLDPYSAVKRMIRGPRYFIYKPYMLAKPRPAWAVCYSINSKNAFGGYVGARDYFFVFDANGVLDHGVDTDFVSHTEVHLECSQPADAPAAAAAS